MIGKYVPIVALFLLCCLSAVSQVFLKKASQKEYMSFLLQYLTPYVFIGYGLLFFVLIANIYLLRFIPVSVSSTISESIPLILSLGTGKLFFHETITVSGLIGVLFVIAGIILVIL